MVKAETFHAWQLRFDGLLLRQGRTSHRLYRNTAHAASAKGSPKPEFQNCISSYHL